MAEVETYVTKSDPSFEDWLAFNQNLFASLRGEDPEGPIQYAPFTDADDYAAEEGISVEGYFDRAVELVGPLGRAALALVHTEMDDSWHITVEVDALAAEKTE